MTVRSRIFRAALVVAVAFGSTVAVAQEQVIKIGSHLPLTGALARAGNAELDGVKVAIQEQNEEYAGKYRFKLLVIDDESSPAKAISAVEKLAAQGAVAITGGYGSNIVGPASTAAHDLGLPYITSGGTAAGLVHRGYGNFFRISNIQGYSKAVAGYIEMIGADRVAILYSKKDAPSGLAHDTQELLTEAGIESTMHAFQGGSSNFTALVNRVKLQDNADVIAMFGYENDYVGILRSAQLLKPDVKAIVGGWELATIKMNQEFNDLVQGVAGTTMLSYPVKFTNAAARAFAQRFEKMHGHLPDYLGMWGYVQTKLMINAIVHAAKSGDLAGKRIADALRATDTQTVMGRIQFNDIGENVNFAQRIGQHQGDNIELVWPESAATAEVKLPARPW